MLHTLLNSVSWILGFEIDFYLYILNKNAFQNEIYCFTEAQQIATTKPNHFKGEMCQNHKNVKHKCLSLDEETYELYLGECI